MECKVDEVFLRGPRGIVKLFGVSEEPVISSLKNVNIFVGKNNSGKSLLLRTLFSNEFLFTNQEIIKFINDYPFWKDMREKGDDIYQGEPEFFTEDLNSVSNLTSNGYLSFEKMSLFRLIVERWAVDEKARDHYDQKIRDVTKKYREELIGPRKIYIPILRALRTFEGINAVDVFGKQIKTEYFSDHSQIGLVDSDNGSLIYTGQDFYEKLTSLLLGYAEDREKISLFEKELSEHFFESMTISLVPHQKEKVVHIKIGDDEQLPIQHLGDGLQNLIVCTFPIITAKTPTVFFIEEPEIYMHPGMQRAFMELLQKYNQHQYFLTTHSNHLLSIASEEDDVSIYHFNKIRKDAYVKFNIELRSAGDKSILQNIGVRNSSVFIANCTVWIEGITDRKYLKTYMKKYLDEIEKSNRQLFQRYKDYREDLHYSFVEYQGSTLTHWGFDEEPSGETISAKSLCGNPLLIADGDIRDKNEGERVRILREALDDDFFLLECKEIENLIPVEVLRKHPWVSKSITAEKITFDAYYKAGDTSVAIGTFLQDLFDSSENKSRKFAAKSGTINEKLKFCNDAVEWMNNHWDEWELNTPIREICERIFTHIEKYN